MGSKSTQTGRFYSCFRRSLTENSVIAIQDCNSGIARKFSCADSAERSYKLSRRKDLPAGRGDRISANNQMAGMEKIQWQLQTGRDRIMESWNGLYLKPISSQSLPCRDIPTIPWFWTAGTGSNPCQALPVGAPSFQPKLSQP